MNFRQRPASWLFAAALALAPAFAFAQTGAATPAAGHHESASPPGEDLQEYVEGANRLEGRIIAPCCWNQTIDIHGSEPAYELRREIRKRLKAGETPEAIEASFVQRFGPKILAVGAVSAAPLLTLASFLAAAFGVAGVAGFFMLKRWSARSRESKGAAKPAGSSKPPKAGAGGAAGPKRDALDDRLDQELSEIENQS